MKKDLREDIFVRHWIATRNGTRSAIAAGYAEASARTTAHNLLKKPNILAKIKAHQEKIMKEYDITEERVLQEWAKIAFSNLKDYVSFDEDGVVTLVNSEELSDEQFSVISEINNITKVTKEGDEIKDVRFKLHDKMKALEALSRYLDLFNDKQRVEVKTINVSVDPEDEDENE